MADKKLSEVTKVTDMAYVPVILSDGSVGQIAKADLASVVAGVMNTNDLSTFVKSSSVLSNIDEVKPNGVYAFSLSEDDANVSTLGYRYGQVSYYFNNRHWGVYQLVSLNIEFADGERLYIRRHNSDGTWQPWHRLDNFGYNSLAELATGVADSLPCFKYKRKVLNNAASISMDIKAEIGASEAPLKWEVLAGGWNAKITLKIEGICRYFRGSDAGDYSSATVTSVSDENYNPTASITSEGVLTVAFNSSISYVYLFVYYA